MKGCKNCPAFAKCTVTYRGSACAALRRTYGLEADPELKTNADRALATSGEEVRIMFDKPSNWGTRYQFPENMRLETDGYGARLIENISVQMADQYEALVVDTIAREARAAGASDVTVLNKSAILTALMRRTPRGFTRYRDSRCCPNCREELTGRGLFCSTCGQAIDWTREEQEIAQMRAPYTNESEVTTNG